MGTGTGTGSMTSSQGSPGSGSGSSNGGPDLGGVVSSTLAYKLSRGVTPARFVSLIFSAFVTPITSTYRSPMLRLWYLEIEFGSANNMNLNRIQADTRYNLQTP